MGLCPNPASLFDANLAWADKLARGEARGLPPSFDPADLAQEAKIELWKQAQRYDPQRGVPFQAFAYRAVRGAVLMSVRRRRYRDATNDPLGRQQIDERPLPDDQMISDQERLRTSRRETRQLARVVTLLAVLNPVDEYLVRRVYLERVDLNELEGVWGIKLGTRLRAAIRKLKKAL